MVVRRWYYVISFFLIVWIIAINFVWEPIWWFMLLIGPLFLLGIYDIFQTKSNILRNYPIFGHLRFLLLKIRPQIQQYFIDTDQSGRPFNKEMRDLVYERAQNTRGPIPFGTKLDVHEIGYEWVNHSITPTILDFSLSRILVGGPHCRQPYHASRFNISAMSFGALSPEAIRALNRGAKLGKFFQNTGEGGVSKYHLIEGGDLVWQIGSGYFGAHDENGHFNSEKFANRARLDNIKMIELKLSQGAKPAHGGVLPGRKVTAEIAEARDVPVGEDCISPAKHSAFNTPLELMQFIAKLRELSNGKPIGFKLCIGIRNEFMAICKAMLETGIYPDFITIDGSEGGTGAAPIEFVDSIGTSLTEGLIFAHNCLVGINLRKNIRLIASGKIISGFDLATKMALGADICNSARGMMLALGCIQSIRCHTNTCPTGIATQDSHRRYALNVDIKAPYIKNFHHKTLEGLLDVLGAMGLKSPNDLCPAHINRRITRETATTYAELFDFLAPGQLLNGTASKEYMKYWRLAQANSFDQAVQLAHSTNALNSSLVNF